MPRVEQELLTLPEHLSSYPIFSGVRVTRPLVLYVSFVDRCLSFCTFSFGHCVVCLSSIYGFVLSLWYLQTLLIHFNCMFPPSLYNWMYCCFIILPFHLLLLCVISNSFRMWAWLNGCALYWLVQLLFRFHMSIFWPITWSFLNEMNRYCNYYFMDSNSKMWFYYFDCLFII